MSQAQHSQSSEEQSLCHHGMFFPKLNLTESLDYLTIEALFQKITI
jgi:hypothetical protein